MNGEQNEPPKTIDDAITACDKNIGRHRISSLIMVLLLVGCVIAFYYAFKSQQLTATSILSVMGDCKIGGQPLSEVFLAKTHFYFAMIGLFIVVFGILIAVYRFHLVEIARNEQIKLGFWRIRIAARNTDPGFKTEVRQALTRDAFSFDRTTKPEKGKKVESPVPGHPGSDLATGLVNKILENFDFEVKKKP